MKNTVLLPVVSMFVYYSFLSGIIPEHSVRYQPGDIQDSTLTITLTAVGDLMCHSDQYLYCHTSADSFDFTSAFRYVEPYLSASDITIGNFETVLAGKGKKYSGYPFFNAPDDYAEALKSVGFDIVTHANNHCLDRGENGIYRTLKTFDSFSLVSTGTFRSQADRDSLRILTVRNTSFGFLSYTYGTNGNPIPRGKDYLVNLIDTASMKNDIANARNKCELLIVFLHFGVEYERRQNEEQDRIVDFLAQNGVDIILGSHPHVLQPVKFFKCSGASLDTGFCAFSLGNFYSNQRWRYSDAGTMIKISFEKKTSARLRISSVEAVPTWVFKGSEEGRKRFYIIPSTVSADSAGFNFLTPSDKIKFRQAADDTRKTLTEYSTRITTH